MHHAISCSQVLPENRQVMYIQSDKEKGVVSNSMYN